MRATLRRCLLGVMLCVMLCALLWAPAYTRAEDDPPAAAPASNAQTANPPANAPNTQAAGVHDDDSIEVAGKKFDSLAVACLFGFVFGGSLTLARVLMHLRRQMLGRA